MPPGNPEYEAALRNLRNQANGAMPGNPYGNPGPYGTQAVSCSCCDMRSLDVHGHAAAAAEAADMTPRRSMESRRIALGGIFSALSIVVMLMGGILPFATFFGTGDCRDSDCSGCH